MALIIEILGGGVIQKKVPFVGTLEEAAKCAVMQVEQNNCDAAVIKDETGKLVATLKLGL